MHRDYYGISTIIILQRSTEGDALHIYVPVYCKIHESIVLITNMLTTRKVYSTL
jgi:hypothetical protein